MPRSLERGFQVKALGEIAIGCRDLATMEAFYRETIGLEILARRESGIVFFRLAESYAGHVQVLALFDNGGDGQRDLGQPSALHHIALALGAEEQDAAMRFFESKGLTSRIEVFDWIGWRGLFVKDPEGNTVELVAALPGHPVQLSNAAAG